MVNPPNILISAKNTGKIIEIAFFSLCFADLKYKYSLDGHFASLCFADLKYKYSLDGHFANLPLYVGYQIL